MTTTKLSPSRKLIYNRTLTEGFTQSEFDVLSTCAQKWDWSYNHMLKSKGSISMPLLIGSTFHDAMEQFYSTKGERVNIATLQFPEGSIPTEKDVQDQNYWNHVLPKMILAYQIYYKKDTENWTIESIERELDFEYRGFRIRGKIDLTIRFGAGRFIVDHKTAARFNLNVVAGWDFKFQFLFYLWAMWKTEGEYLLNGFVINAIKKPELRVKKTESIPEFAQRVFEDMVAEPEKYFYRDILPITLDVLQHFETTVVDHKINKLMALVNPDTDPVLAEAILHDKNTNECQKYIGYPCPFIDLCRHGEKMLFMYETKEQKHAELEIETE